MKKIIVGILSFVMLITAQNVFAAGVTWNQASNDCKGISIINATTSEGYQNPCWPNSSVSANAGEVINVRIYYHNTGTTTATNTHVVLIPNTSLNSSSTSKSFYGRIVSDQGSVSFNEVVKANLSSSQSLTFLSAKWYTNNTSATLTPLLNGQNGSEVLTDNGLDIGSITPGWSSQGAVVIAFRVSSNTPPQLCQDTSATNYGGALPCTYPPQVCQDHSAINYGGALPCVYPQPTYCIISNFQANPTSIIKGNSSTLSWNTSNCSSVNISNIGNVNTSGSQAVYPTITKTYTLTAYSSTGAVQTRTAKVNVNQPQVMTGNLIASNSSCLIASGNSTCAIPFSWTTQNPVATSSVTHNGVTVGNGNNGNQSFIISNGSQTYYLYNNGEQLDSETVSASCISGTSWNGSYCMPAIVNNCLINNFSASPTSITNGDVSVLNWNTSNCTNVVISNLGYNVPTSGSQAVYPTITKTYTLTAYGSTGVTQTRTATVYVSNIQVCEDPSATNYKGSLPCVYPPQLCKDPSATNYNGALPCVYPPQTYCLINNFSASPTSITSGDVSVLNWNTSNCTNVVISNLGYNVPTSGSQAVYPTTTKTYVLTAYGSTGATQTRTATVYVDDTDDNNCSITSFTASDTSIDEGDSTILRWNTNDCDRVSISKIGSVDEDGSEKVYPTNDTTYVLTAYNANGSTKTRSLKIYVDENNNNNNYDYCSIDSFTSNKIYINSGDSVTLRWNTTDCDYVDILGIGNVSLDGSRIIYPTHTTTYTLRGTGNNSDSRSITINVNYNPVIPPVIPIYNTNVVTTVATNISQTGAQLNGLITSTNSANANVYFEYGTNVNLGLRTNSRATNSNANFNEYVTGLSSNTIYYFQAVSEGPNGISRGSIQVFKTLGYITPTNPVKPIIIQGPTVSSSSSPIMLRIENRYQNIGMGDIIDYVVYYKNISSSKLTNPMVQVFIPKGLTLLNASRGTYSVDNRTLSAPIEDLVPSAEGVIYLQARVDDMETNLAQIVTTAILVYTNPNGAQENAMAYVLNNPKIVNLLGASAFFGNMFGMSLINWLLLIILILVLILIARSFYNRRNVINTTHTTVN